MELDMATLSGQLEQCGYTTTRLGRIFFSIVFLCSLLAGLAGGCASHDEALLNPEPFIATGKWQDRNGLDSRATASQPVTEYTGTNFATTASYHYPSTPPSVTDPLIAVNYQAADQLVKNLGMPGQRYRSLLVTAFVNTDQPEQSPALGRVLGEQVASRLTQLGYTVVEELKTGDASYRKRPAEIDRPWSARTLGFQYGVQAVVAGTYAVAQDRVFINVRLIDAASGIPVSAYDYAVPLNGATLALITGCMRQGQWICRLP
jgi:TolB-like protein